jgi:phosphopantothenoylcysteine decarboxylase/phosphopantothenate--cysteine ligase
MNVLLGISGGIAAYKSAYLASLLKKDGMEVNVVMTDAATEFVRPLTFETLTNNPVAVDLFDIKRAWEVEHVSLARKADAAVLAPATANTVAKLACGIADNMLTTVFLALTCPVVIVPAMNTAMLDNAATRVNLDILRERGFHVMEAAEGRLACGDSGAGRMKEPEEILEYMRERTKKKRD